MTHEQYCNQLKKKNTSEKSLVLGKKNLDLNCLIKHNVIYSLSTQYFEFSGKKNYFAE